MIVQVVINHFVGMSMNANDARVLQKFTLYEDVWFKEPFPSNNFDDIIPYLLWDKSYILLSWIMIPHKEGNHSILESLCN